MSCLTKVTTGKVKQQQLQPVSQPQSKSKTGNSQHEHYVAMQVVPTVESNGLVFFADDIK